MSARIFLVDDQALVRAGFRMLIEAQPDMEVVGEADDGRAALEALAVTRADLVLMDVRMPRLDGVQATERLIVRSRGDRPAPKVIVLNTFDLDEYVFAAIRAGASGFLLKDARPEELLGAVWAVLSGDAVVAPSATRRLLEHVVDALPADTGEDPRLALLTPRERKVLLEVARGRSNAEIAVDLFMAEATVKTHVGTAARQARPARPRPAGRLRVRDRPRTRRTLTAPPAGGHTTGARGPPQVAVRSRRKTDGS